MSSLSDRRLLFASVLLIITAIVTHGIGIGEFDYNVDESQHAATGLFVASLLKDIPRHPVAYTYRYYAQYPALSGVIHWPPLFYLWEGLMFLALGPSVVTARLAILLFALLGLIYWFRFTSELLNDWGAALSTLVVALLPTVLLFEKAVMLEIPCLSLCIAALYYWYQYLVSERVRELYRFALFFSAAMLTKQNAVFLPVVCLLSVAALKRWWLLFDRRVLGPAALITALIAPFYTVVYVVHWKAIAMDLMGRNAAIAQRGSVLVHYLHAGLFYFRALPEQFGWPLLIMALAGVLTWRIWSRREDMVLMLAWIVGCYLTFTLISHKEARYAFYWVPPVIFFVVGLLTAPWKLRATRCMTGVLACILLAQVVVEGWRYQRPYIEGYAALAAGVKHLGNPGILLFQASVPANFIFFLRRLDTKRQFVVLRKTLRAARLKVGGGVEDEARTPEEVREVIVRKGVKYAVISDVPPAFEGEISLRLVLRTDPKFKLLGTFPVTSNEPDWRLHELFLYQNMEWSAPQDRYLRVRMLTIGNDVVVPWDELTATSTAAYSKAATTVR